jgi:hypothetical protein
MPIHFKIQSSDRCEQCPIHDFLSAFDEAGSFVPVIEFGEMFYRQKDGEEVSLSFFRRSQCSE